MIKLCRNTFFVLVALFAVSANGAPMAYSVNSDSGSPAPTTDSLYSIDLATGAEQRKGSLFNGIETRIDTEGLAFSPDGTLWGVDDDSQTLFPINLASGSISFNDEINLQGGLPPSGNDFGMTFTCDGNLYVTSVLTQTIYRLDPLDGNRQAIGGEGALNANISAIAAFGNPVSMYGLGNGQFENGNTDSPNLYRIDMQTGQAILIGALGNEAGDYNQGGLAFDDQGVLWAITDRRIINNQIADEPSQILRIDTLTGAATLVYTTIETGFESFAIAPPTCSVQEQRNEQYPRIPTLDHIGRGLLVLLLLAAGIAGLRRRTG